MRFINEKESTVLCLLAIQPNLKNKVFKFLHCDADKIWIDVWKRKFDIFALKELGWKSESEDTIWTFE